MFRNKKELIFAPYWN